MKPLVRQLTPAVAALVLFTVVLGLVYPLVTTGISQLLFDHRADGSLIERDGTVVGSELIGQAATAPGYFHPRPSAAGDGYDGMASSGSNLGPTNPVLLDTVAGRVAVYRAENGLAEQVAVPVDAVTASGSGLDPHISVANARLQAPRVAEARSVGEDTVLELIDRHTTSAPLSILGDAGVNVLLLNLALDELGAG
jgi:potassium-transporting ATPase KdpC subunit